MVDIFQKNYTTFAIKKGFVDIVINEIIFIWLIIGTIYPPTPSI
jgi:hypothetical protein